MFWSGTLLNSTGPLAKAWLSANMERKLSKTHVLQHNLQDSVDAIITPSQAPLALRLSGQLLLGVVRIYGRKARYLLDDCNEALMKIKMVRHIPQRKTLRALLTDSRHSAPLAIMISLRTCTSKTKSRCYFQTASPPTTIWTYCPHLMQTGCPPRLKMSLRLPLAGRAA